MLVYECVDVLSLLGCSNVGMEDGRGGLVCERTALVRYPCLPALHPPSVMASFHAGCSHHTLLILLLPVHVLLNVPWL